MKTRREFLSASAIAITSLTYTSRSFTMIPNTSTSTSFTLPNLPYAYDALDKYIDKMTMEIHHSKHHAAYVNNLNKAIDGLDVPTSLPDLMTKIGSLPQDKQTVIRNNGGGHLNHTMFWEIMAPEGRGGAPQSTLLEALNAQFGSIEKFQEQFNNTALARFGSGWVWLYEKNNKLLIGSTANQDNPLMDERLSGISGKPILCLDVWEHAYYLKYQNRRIDYVKAWWNIVNWNKVQENFLSH